MRSLGFALLAAMVGRAAASIALAQAPAAEASPSLPSPAEPQWIEVTLGGEIFDQRNQMPHVQWLSWTNGALPDSPVARGVAATAFGFGADPAAAGVTSFSASMAYLRTEAPGLAPDERRLAISLIGTQLSLGYSATVTNNPSMESIFQNTHNGGHEGGICGDIHTYLSRTATALGYTAAGTHTADWWIEDGSGGGHVVAHYRDPVTGEYYLQNYGDLYATGQKTLPNLLEVSTRILGLAWASSVESRPGTMHLYVPRQTRWISERVVAEAGAPSGGPKVRLALDNREQTAGLHYGWEAGAQQQFKAYAVAARFDADEGTYAFTNLGAAYAGHGSVSIGRPWLEEAGFSALGYGGGLWMDSPILRPAPGRTVLRSVAWRRSTALYGAVVSGFLRQGRTTETAEVEHSAVTLPTQGWTELRFAIDHAFAAVPLEAYWRRVWNVANANGQPKNAAQVVTAYDRLGARWHWRPAETVTVGLTADGFALGGVENGEAAALRCGVDATWRAGGAGEFTLGEEWGKVVRNRTRDPYYDLPATHRATLGWRRPVGGHASVSVQAGYGEGPPIQPLGDFGRHLPGLDDGARQWIGRATLTMAY